MSKRKDSPEEIAQMENWLQQAAAELHIPADRLIGLSPDLLDLVGIVARGISRPAAPLSTYLIGYVAGSGGDPEEALVTLQRLAEGDVDLSED